MGVFLDYIGLQVVRNERKTVSLGLGGLQKKVRRQIIGNY